MQRSALCRSRRELSNAYLLAKIGVDTAENEPLDRKVRKKVRKNPILFANIFLEIWEIAKLPEEVASPRVGDQKTHKIQTLNP